MLMYCRHNIICFCLIIIIIIIHTFLYHHKVVTLEVVAEEVRSHLSYESGETGYFWSAIKTQQTNSTHVQVNLWDVPTLKHVWSNVLLHSCHCMHTSNDCNCNVDVYCVRAVWFSVMSWIMRRWFSERVFLELSYVFSNTTVSILCLIKRHPQLLTFLKVINHSAEGEWPPLFIVN